MKRREAIVYWRGYAAGRCDEPQPLRVGPPKYVGPSRSKARIKKYKREPLIFEELFSK